MPGSRFAQHQVQYALHRQEVQAWYWGQWRRKFWLVHLMLIVLGGFLASGIIKSASEAFGISFGPVQALTLGFIASGMLVALMPLFPMIMFKPELRTLWLDEDGVHVTYRKGVATRTWDQIRTATLEEKGVVLAGNTGNAFIIPDRAFKSGEEKMQFVTFAQQRITGKKPAT